MAPLAGGLSYTLFKACLVNGVSMALTDFLAAVVSMLDSQLIQLLVLALVAIASFVNVSRGMARLLATDYDVISYRGAYDDHDDDDDGRPDDYLYDDWGADSSYPVLKFIGAGLYGVHDDDDDWLAGLSDDEIDDLMADAEEV